MNNFWKLKVLKEFLLFDKPENSVFDNLLVIRPTRKVIFLFIAMHWAQGRVFQCVAGWVAR